ARAEDQAERVRRAVLAAAVLLLSLALLAPNAAHAAAASAPPDCPDSVRAPSAIVIEVSTGIVACARQADKHRLVGSTTKLMTALLTLERAKLTDVFTASNYRPA